MPILALLVFGVLAEIATFIAVGKAIGIAATLLLAIASCLGGLMLVRLLGLDALRRAEESLARGESPAGAVFDAGCLVLAAILLALPGFLSDIVALMLLIRPLRRFIGGLLWRRLQASPDARVWIHTRYGRTTRSDVVEGEFVEIIDANALPKPGRQAPGRPERGPEKP